MLLSEHLYCVAIVLKMTEQVEQRICIKYCIRLQHSSMENIQVIQKATAMGNCWLAPLSQQCTHSCIMSHAEIFDWTSDHPGHSAPLQTRLGTLWLLAFPKLKSLFKGKRFQTIDESQENIMGQLMAIGRTVWGPKAAALKGTEVSLSYIQCFLYLLQ